MEEYEKINAILYMKDNGDSVIKLEFPDEIEINLSKNEQSGLKNVFSKILENALKEKFIFEFACDENYKNQLIIDVAECYIASLSLELEKLYSEESFKELYKGDKKV